MYRVFIVDDEPFIIDGLYDVVDWAAFGLEITGSAENGLEALEALRDTPADIVITDISMPEMTGLELIRELRGLKPGLKFIVLSGFNEFDYIKEGLRLGIENYLLKPINFDELQETLAGTVEKLNAEDADRLFRAHDNRILRDNILSRWLSGRIAPAELAERAALLQLKLDKPYLLTAVVRTGELIAEVSHAAERMAEQIPGLIPFLDPDGDLVILILLDKPEEGKIKALETFSGLRERVVSGKIRISLGTVEELDSGAQRSYSNAKKAQEYFLVLDPPDLMDYEQLGTGSQAEEPDMAGEWQEYARLIASRNKEALLDKIEETFKRAQRLEGVTPAIIQSMAVELMIRLKMELKEIKQADQPELYREGFERVLKADTMEELAALVKEAAEVTVDALLRDVKSPVIAQVLSYVHEHYNEALSLKALSQQYNIHPVYLGHLFSKETNESFTEYINKYRIDKAKEMLKETNLKVHEIAAKVGYYESGYFYKQFKKYVGISPTDYKGLH